MNILTLPLLALVSFGGSPEALGGFRQLQGPEDVGRGPIRTQTRRVGNFRRVKAGNAFRIRFRIGSSRRVEVRAHSNLLPILTTTVRGETLVLEATRRYRTQEPVVVTITNPELRAIELSGASSAQVGRLNEREFEAEVSGAAKLRIDGSARGLRAEVSGAGRMEMSGLRAWRLNAALSGAANLSLAGSAEQAILSISGAAKAELAELAIGSARVEGSGAGKARLRVRNMLQVDGSGAFKATYIGSPRVRSRVTGGASVSRS